MPGAISDSSTIIHLAKIGRLNLLREFHKKIFMPPAVYNEVVREGRECPGSFEVSQGRQEGWIEVVSPANRPLVDLLQMDLHKGESETIALAVQLAADIVFLDESEARRIARVYGLSITGVIGVLIRAKHEARIPSLKEELDRLRNDAGFWIGDDVYYKALRASGEGRDGKE
jgi:predicted nucleic acid-binding protein